MLDSPLAGPLPPHARGNPNRRHRCKAPGGTIRTPAPTSGAQRMQEHPSPTVLPPPATGPVLQPAGSAPPVAPKRKLKKLRLAAVLAGLCVLAVISTVFGMLISVSSDLPALENKAEYR